MLKYFQTLSQLEDLVQQFSDQSLPVERWTHQAHLSVAFWYVSKHSIEEAAYFLRSGIILFNEAVGTANTNSSGYHETITLFWIYTIHNYLKISRTDDVLDGLNSFLSDPSSSKEYVLRFYSIEVLFSGSARAFWTEPDLIPISSPQQKAS